MKAVFDTNILIDYLNGVQQAKEEINLYSHCLISSITWMEVLVGANEENEPIIRAFLSQFEQIPVTEEIAEKAVSIRRGKKYACLMPLLKQRLILKMRCLFPEIPRTFLKVILV